MTDNRIPVWVVLAWLAILLSAWAPLGKEWARRHPADRSGLAQSQALFLQHRYSESIAVARRFLKTNPHSAEAWVNIGISDANLGKWDDGIAATQKALLIDPGSQLALNNLRWMLARVSDAKPTAESWQGRALDAWRRGDYPDCVVEARKALSLFAEYTKAFNLLSICYLGLGKYDEAIASARQAVHIEPGFQLAKNNLDLAIAQQARAARNPAPAKAPVSEPPRDINALLNASVAAYRAGRMQECVDEARSALHIDAGSALAWNNVAACSNDLGRFDEAIAAAGRALELQPDLTLARNNLAVALSRKGNQNAPAPH